VHDAFVDTTVDCEVTEGCAVKIQAELWEVNATLLIGPDDETWDLSLTVPVHVVDEIVARAASGMDT